MQLTPVLHELTASFGKEPSVTCSMLQAGNTISSDSLPLLLNPGLPDTPRTPYLLLSNSSRACPQGTSCQCILPTRQYFQGAHVSLILPHGFTFDKPLSNAPRTPCCFFDLFGLGQRSTNTAVDGPSCLSSALGFWRMRSFSPAYGHESLPALYLHMKTAALALYNTH